MSSDGASKVFSRTIDLLGPAAFRRLQRSKVVVVGLGGVGSHAAVALARGGVGALRLVDPDPVTASSLNRHAAAVAGDVGRPKCTVMQEHLHRIRPELPVEALPVLADVDTLESVLQGELDLVVDAIDSLGPKTSLLAACCDRGLSVVSSMGASSRTDPTAIRIADLLDTQRCPLARLLRKRLRRLGLGRGIIAVFSTEPARPPLPPDLDDPPGRPGRERHRQSSLSTLPGIFGYSLANVALLRLAASQSENDPGAEPGSG